MARGWHEVRHRRWDGRVAGRHHVAFIVTLPGPSLTWGWVTTRPRAELSTDGQRRDEQQGHCNPDHRHEGVALIRRCSNVLAIRVDTIHHRRDTARCKTGGNGETKQSDLTGLKC